MINKIKFDVEKLEFHASCADGLSIFLLDEIQSYKLRILSENRGGVFFKGRYENILNFILNTRFSSRVAFNIFKERILSPEELYERCLKLPWEEIFPFKSSFKIDSFTKDTLNDSRYSLYKLKDAIRDRLRSKNREDVGVDRDIPDLVLLLRSSGQFVSIELSITSNPYHKRGYRLETIEAPLKETTAQALLEFSEWRNEEVLIDPMCGSGTILIEAALLKYKEHLNYYLVSKSKVFTMLFDSLPDSRTKPFSKTMIYGFDRNPMAIAIARDNAKRAGVEDFIQFEVINIQRLERLEDFETGCIISNPPYGERMGEAEEVIRLYSEIGILLKEKFNGFTFTIVCGNKALLGNLKLKEDKSLNLNIAKLKAKFVKYSLN